jgi:hypothetical protein
MAVPDDRKVQSNEKADSDVIEPREVPANSPQMVKAINNAVPLSGRIRLIA